MNWKKAGPFSARGIEIFFRGREKYCVSACSRYLRKTGEEKIWYTEEAALLHTRRFLFPVFHFTKPPSFFTLPEQLKKTLMREGLHAVQGLRAGAELLEDALEQIGCILREAADYDLMELTGAPPGPLQTPSNLAVRFPDMKDAGALFPLQEGYEKEEVLPKGAAFNPALCRRNLESLISGGLVLAAEINGRFVGKININAESFTRIQIGGVYVDPEYRGRGIARFMTAEFLRRFAPRGKTFTLFVRKNNPAARSIYAGSGFTKFADYRISYY